MRRVSRFRRFSRLSALSTAAFAPLNRKRLAGIAAAAAAILLSVLLFWPNIETVFNVVAHTEYVEGVVAKPSSGALTMSWKLDNVTLCRGAPADPAVGKEGEPCRAREIDKAFAGEIFLSEGVQFRARRIAGGHLSVVLEGQPDRIRIQSATGAILSFEAPTRILFADFGKRVEDGTTLVLPFVAKSLTIGREPSMRTPVEQPLLRSAQISMLSRSVIGGRPFFAGEIELDEGDQFSVDTRDEQAGVITVDERPMMNVIYRAEATQARARRFYVPEDILISASPFERLRNDPALAGLVSILMALVAIYGVIKVEKP